MIEYAAGDHRDQGYLSIPPGGSGLGVLVIQEWWGLVDHIRGVCDRLAAEGFVGLAPDLYDGRSTTEPDEAQKEMMNLRIEAAGSDIEAASAYLLDSPRVTGSSIGVVGFCMGGGLALYAASRLPEITACVAFYGVGPARESLDTSSMKAAVQGHWGERDRSYDHATIEALETRLRDAAVDVESFWYDADHAFFNDDRPEVYDQEAARLAWERTTAFLHRRLAR